MDFRCPPPRLVPWGFLVQSVFCWSLSPGIWLYLATVRLSCLVVWSVVMARLLSSLFLMAPIFAFPHRNKGFGPVWGSALTPCCGCCSGAFLPALRYSPSSDPFFSVQRLHGIRQVVTYSPSGVAPSPSCCCWPPLAFSLLVPVHTKAIMVRNSVSKWSFLRFFLLVVVCLLFLVSLLVFLVCFVAVPVVSQLR